MIKKEEKKAVEIYGILGKSICACAGGIVGFVFGGPYLAIPCIILGSLLGHFIEKTFVKI